MPLLELSHDFFAAKLFPFCHEATTAFNVQTPIPSYSAGYVIDTKYFSQRLLFSLEMDLLK